MLAALTYAMCGRLQRATEKPSKASSRDLVLVPLSAKLGSPADLRATQTQGCPKP